MKKQLSLILVFCLIFFCAAIQNKVEKRIENGVEIVLNQLEPYKIKGELSSLTLEKEISIDTEDDSVAVLGLTDIWAINVDSRGNIYLWNNPRSRENLVYKFDSEGTFIKSFLKMGQGPGDVQSPNLPIITVKNEFVLTDHFPKKLLYLSLNGKIKKKVSLESQAGIVYPLENGNYFVSETRQEPGESYSDNIMNLYSSKMEQIKQLMSYREDDIRTASQVNGTMINKYYHLWTVSNNKIYVGNNDQSEYEILVYDYNGNSVREIRKEFKPIEVSNEYKKEILRPYENSQNAIVRNLHSALS